MSNSGHSVLAFLDLGDCDVAGVNGNLIGSSVSFVLGQLVNVDGPFLSVDLDDFSLVTLASSSEDDDLIILSDGEGSDSILGSEGL